ncbi:uncharacterized protein [Ptychodera flava]|uniref:uncharacterized protein n=1 Tax=Ptychodera flava TaxID=63121 RepID=UPI003969EFAF
MSLLKSRLIGKEATVRRLERENEEQKLLISQLTEKRQGKQTEMERPFGGGEGVTDDIITYKLKQPCLDTDTVPRPEDKNGSVDEVNFVCNVDNTSNSVIVCEPEHHAELQTPPTVEKSPKRKGTQGVKSSPRSPFMSKFWKRKSKRSKSDSAANMYASHENLAKKENLI